MRPGRKAILLLALLIAGTALAVPAPFLRLEEQGGANHYLGIPDDRIVIYRYRHSVYDAMVEERYRVEASALLQVEIRSVDRRAIEYYGLPGEPSSQDGALSLAVSAVPLPVIDLRVLPEARQSIVLGARTVDLSGRLGERQVRLSAVQAPRVAGLLFRGP